MYARCVIQTSPTGAFRVILQSYARTSTYTYFYTYIHTSGSRFSTSSMSSPNTPATPYVVIDVYVDDVSSLPFPSPPFMYLPPRNQPPPSTTHLQHPIERRLPGRGHKRSLLPLPLCLLHCLRRRCRREQRREGLVAATATCIPPSLPLLATPSGAAAAAGGREEGGERGRVWLLLLLLAGVGGMCGNESPTASVCFVCVCKGV